MKKFNLSIKNIALFAAISFQILASNDKLQASNSAPFADTCRLDNDAQEFTKNFDKTFTVDKNEVVFLANKYGKIEVKTGGTNQVVVNVRVRANASSQEEAQKMFDRVNIAFSNGPDYVKAETIIESQSSGNWRWKTWGTNSSDFRIDYEVTMPVNSRLDLSNKYGNSHIAALNAAVNIDHKYGDFKLEGATAAVIELAYGGGQLGAISALSATVSYGKLTSPNVNALRLKSKYSEFKFGKMQMADIVSAYDNFQLEDVETLKFDGKYGDLNAGMVKDLTLKSSYTDVKIKRLEGNADCQTNYGDVEIGSIKTGFGTINIKGNYTDYSLAVDPSVSYYFDANCTYADLKQPASIKTSMDSETNSQHEIIGVVGNAATKSMVKVRLSHGDFKIR